MKTQESKTLGMQQKQHSSVLNKNFSKLAIGMTHVENNLNVRSNITSNIKYINIEQWFKFILMNTLSLVSMKPINYENKNKT